MRSAIVILVVFALAVAFGVVRAHTDPTSASAPTYAAAPVATEAPAPNTVLMEPGTSGGAAQFVPASITVKAGQSLTFTNRDQTSHSATADNGSFDTGILSPGESKTITFKKAGRFTYADILVSDMSGVVRVTP